MFDLQPVPHASGSPRPCRDRGGRASSQNGIFLLSPVSDYSRRMPEFPPDQVTPFVFSDPTGKRWPRLRLILLIAGVLVFPRHGAVRADAFRRAANECAVFAAAIEGSTESAPKRKSSRPTARRASLLWQKFGAARQAAKKLAGTAPTRSARSRGRNRPTTKCASRFTPMAIRTATRRSSNTPRRSLMFVRNGWR